MSEVPRYSLPELAAISSGARDRLSHVSRILIVAVGLLYVAWQPMMLWLSPSAWDPLGLRLGIAGLCVAAAWASTRRRWQRHLLRMTHGLAAIVTLHLFVVAGVNHLPFGYLVGLFVLLAGGGLVFFTIESMLAYGGFTMALALAVALLAQAPASARWFLVMGVVSVEAVLALSAYRRVIAQRALLGELEESERRFRDLALRAPVGIYRCDLNARCTFANEEWCQLAGISAEEAQGSGWALALHPDDRERCQKLWQKASLLGTEWEAEFRFLHKDGTIRWVYSRAAIVLGEYGASERVGMTMDITARKQAEESLTRSKELAEAATRAKSEFLAKMSHEIRTPMNGVLGMLELALETPLQPDQKDYVDTAHASAANLLGIINDILDVSRIEARKLEIDAIPFSLRQLLDTSLKPLIQLARGKGLSFELDVGLHVFDGLVGDALRLRQVLVNLVGNAIKFTRQGGIRVTVVQGDANEQDVKLCFSVRDTGIGIPADRLPSIFEPFTQVERVGAMSGTGLGLTISAQLVALMGGKIRVSSTVGTGSAFHVDLVFPRANLDAESLASSTVKSTGRYQSPPSRLRVLVAEDNAVNARVVRHFLEKVGSHVTVAETGQAALDQALGGDFHLIFLDVQMPELTGIEVCAAIRAHEKVSGGHRPIVMLTAQAMKGDREECMAAGADDYVTKPVTRRTLFSAIARLMDQGAFGQATSQQMPALTLTGEDSSGKILAAEPAAESAPPERLSMPGDNGAEPLISDGVLDRVELLARVDGDRSLLAELVRLFVQERPALLGSMEAALRDGDAQELARAAHKAKGAFGNLSAPLAQQCAVELELLARHGELALATDVFLRLTQQVQRLEAELLALTQDDRAA
ncbi:MAG TPA: ATP-binding protein [Polyangiaceae bacterium]|nr:ATP-binding protein [Polyangiaceae bacterium]